MAHFCIEVDRGSGWEVQDAGEAPETTESLIARIADYSPGYPYRAFLDGALVATVVRKDGPNSPPIVARDDDAGTANPDLWEQLIARARPESMGPDGR